MALTKIGTDGVKDDAVTSDKVANSINSAIAANTAKDLTALSAANLTSGTIPDARFPATLPAISGANLTNLPPNRVNRNLIINGAMTIAQRGTSSTSTGYHTVDRFANSWSGTDEACTQAQADVASGTTPYTLGFRKALKITNGNQTSGAEANDIVYIEHMIEAQDIANSGWNYTSSSSYITLSFWVKSSVSQDFKGYLRTADGTSQIYPYSTGTLSANTWTKVTKTISGNSNLQFDNNNDTGLQLYLWPYIGATYTDAGVTENAWAAYASGTRTPVSASTWFTTNDATFEITGFQLEVGSVATDFEHKSFADEIIRCERYYRRDAADGVTHYRFAQGQCTSSTGTQYVVKWPIRMRATPTYAVSGTITAYTVNSQKSTSSHALLDHNTQGGIMTCTASGLSAGNCVDLIASNDGNAYIEFIAEL